MPVCISAYISHLAFYCVDVKCAMSILLEEKL